MGKFFKGAVFLAVCGIVSKAIGALFKVPLTNILGAEGMGVYQLVFPVYTVLLALSSGGLPQAISRLVSRAIASGDEKSVRRVLRLSLKALVVIGGVGTVLLLLLGGGIAYVQGNTAATAAYWALSPSVFFVSVMSVFRGYFQGQRNMFPTAISQFTEQFVKLFAGLFFAYLFLPMGLTSGVAGALVGVSISEAAALVVVVIIYYARRKKPIVMQASDGAVPLTDKEILKEIYRTAIPISLSALIMPMSQLIDSVLVVNLLRVRGNSVSDATTLYGIVTAPISTLLNLCTVLASSLAVSLIPNLVSGDVNKKLSSYLRLTAVVGGLGFAMLFVFGDSILGILYRGLEIEQLTIAAHLLRISSVSVIFMSFTLVYAAAMQAMGKAKIPAVNLFVGAVVKAVLTAVLLLTIGITGAVIASVACYAVTAVLNCMSIKRLTGSYYLKEITAPIACALVAVAGGYAIKNILTGLNVWLMLIVSGLCFCLIFVTLSVMTKSIRRTDLIRK